MIVALPYLSVCLINMEKKSALVGGGIGLAIGMAAMFGIVMGIGSCASSQNVKKVDNVSSMVQRPKMANDDRLWVYALPSGVSNSQTWGADPQLTGSLGEAYSTYSSGSYTGYLSGTIAFSYSAQYGSELRIDGSTGAGETAYVQVGYFMRYNNQQNVYGYNYRGDVFYISIDGLDGADSNLQEWIHTLYGENLSTGYLTIEDGVYVFTEASPSSTGGLISDIFTQVGDSISNFALALGDSVGQTVALFYDDGFTPLGILTLVSGGIALVYWTFYLIKKMLNIGVK